MLIMRYHMDPSLRMLYILEENLARLWAAVEVMFELKEIIFLPCAQAEWRALLVLDFPNFNTYYSELHRILA